MNKQHVLAMLAMLEEVDKFEGATFDWSDFGTKPERGNNLCGTNACVAGWMGLHPYFRNRGMCIERRSNNNVRAYYKGMLNDDACMKFLDIDWNEYEAIVRKSGDSWWAGSDDKSGKQAAEEIRGTLRAAGYDWWNEKYEFEPQDSLLAQVEAVRSPLETEDDTIDEPMIGNAVKYSDGAD